MEDVSLINDLPLRTHDSISNFSSSTFLSPSVMDRSVCMREDRKKCWRKSLGCDTDISDDLGLIEGFFIERVLFVIRTPLEGYRRQQNDTC